MNRHSLKGSLCGNLFSEDVSVTDTFVVFFSSEQFLAEHVRFMSFDLLLLFLPLRKIFDLYGCAFDLLWFLLPPWMSFRDGWGTLTLDCSDESFCFTFEMLLTMLAVACGWIWCKRAVRFLGSQRLLISPRELEGPCPRLLSVGLRRTILFGLSRQAATRSLRGHKNSDEIRIVDIFVALLSGNCNHGTGFFHAAFSDCFACG